ncbi:MAG TPA: histidine kinase dimerization/phospho-acceptor domain-containing protein [Trinickia sp.]|nr:histidine kinase dimerization/phospho-acceptor domain-containing protein [Trinickia sp.]
MTIPSPANDAALDERFARLSAEAALFMRDHVLSLVSHDLRSPLNAIHSWAYVLERKLDASDASAQRALTGIRSGVDQQVKLLEEVVDSTRAQTKTLALVREPFALRPLVESVAGVVRAMLADARHVSLSIESPLDGETLDGDRERLLQALWTMLTFAVEASAPEAAVTVASVIEGGHWQVEVTHTMSFAALGNTELPHALERFACKQATHPREAGRIAWVLALPQRVATAHDGMFTQGETADGEKSTLTLRVPLTA